MALARKLTKEQYDALPDVLKAEYVAKGSEYVIDLSGEDDGVTAMKTARDHEKAARKEAEQKLRDIEAAKITAEEELARKNKDVEGIDAAWQRKLDEATGTSTAKLEKLQGHIKKSLVDNEALKLATSLSSKASKLLLPHIQARVVADFEGDEPVARILGADGKPSTMTFEQLREEFYSNADYAAIIDGSKASGGATGKPDGNRVPPQTFGNKTDNDLAAASATDLVAFLDGK
jgi:hypothetical protein